MEMGQLETRDWRALAPQVHDGFCVDEKYADHGETPGLVDCEEGYFLMNENDLVEGRLHLSYHGTYACDDMRIEPLSLQSTSGMRWCQQ